MIQGVHEQNNDLVYIYAGKFGRQSVRLLDQIPHPSIETVDHGQWPSYYQTQPLHPRPPPPKKKIYGVQFIYLVIHNVKLYYSVLNRA